VEWVGDRDVSHTFCCLHVRCPDISGFRAILVDSITARSGWWPRGNFCGITCAWTHFSNQNNFVQELIQNGINWIDEVTSKKQRSSREQDKIEGKIHNLHSRFFLESSIQSLVAEKEQSHTPHHSSKEQQQKSQQQTAYGLPILMKFTRSLTPSSAPPFGRPLFFN